MEREMGIGWEKWLDSKECDLEGNKKLSQVCSKDI